MAQIGGILSHEPCNGWTTTSNHAEGQYQGAAKLGEELVMDCQIEKVPELQKNAH